MGTLPMHGSDRSRTPSTRGTAEATAVRRLPVKLITVGPALIET